MIHPGDVEPECHRRRLSAQKIRNSNALVFPISFRVPCITDSKPEPSKAGFITKVGNQVLAIRLTITRYQATDD